MNKNLQLLILELLLFILVIVDILYYWEDIYLSAGIAFLVVLFAFFFFHKKEDVAFFFVGAIFGTILNIGMVQFGVIQYSSHNIFGVPLWVPLVWGFIVLLARRIRDTVYDLEHKEIHYKHHENLPHKYIMFVADIITYFLVVGSVIYLWRYSWVSMSSLIVLLLVTSFHFHTKKDKLFILLVAVLGSIVEYFCTTHGVWTYSSQDYLKLPVWLPFMYAMIALVIRRMSITIVNLLFPRKEKN